jgi:putative acetyltransferase
MQITEAKSKAEIEQARNLFREYQAFLNIDLCFQDFEQELASLPGKYAQPSGAILLARVDGELAGCVAVRPIEGDVCEMKRLYVKDKFRGLAIGKKLAQAIIEKAKQRNYKTMRLDTLERLETAMAIYQKLGFKRIEPYYANPLNEVAYWQLEMTDK